MSNKDNEFIRKLYSLGPNLRHIIRRFNEYPDEEVAGFIGNLYSYASSIDDPMGILAKMDRLIASYENLSPIAKTVAGITGIDDDIHLLLENTRLLVSAVLSRFYIDGKRKDAEFGGREEHEQWMKNFRRYLETEFDVLLRVYPSISRNRMLLGRARGLLDRYGLGGLLDQLPSLGELTLASRKLIRSYLVFEGRQLKKYQ
ncbi:MAG: hypothetical protein QXY45_02540 [Candidatus Aenigmatarchaeota archaeon]